MTPHSIRSLIRRHRRRPERLEVVVHRADDGHLSTAQVQRRDYQGDALRGFWVFGADGAEFVPAARVVRVAPIA